MEIDAKDPVVKEGDNGGVGSSNLESTRVFSETHSHYGADCSHGSNLGTSLHDSRSGSSLGMAPKIEDFELLKPISRGAFGKGEIS